MMHGKAGWNKAFCSNKQKADLCLSVLSFEIKLKSQVQEDQGEERGVIFGDKHSEFFILPREILNKKTNRNVHKTAYVLC